jgi:DNA-binding NarL/FixJ family response regulator
MAIVDQANSNKRRVRVLIADDQTLFREGIEDVLANEKTLEVIGTACDGHEAVRLAKQFKPDIILMDIKLPLLDGIAATREIRREYPSANIMILSSYEDDEHVLEAVQAGANGYLSKMLPATELLAALKNFAKDGVMIPPQIIGIILQGLRQLSDGPKRPSSATLTQSEVKALLYLSQGLSNKEMAGNMGCAVKTIKNHLNNMFQKLRVANRTEAVVKGIELGLLSPAPPVDLDSKPATPPPTTYFQRIAGKK